MIYLDHNSTTFLSSNVQRMVLEHYNNNWPVNPSVVYARQAKDELERSRFKILSALKLPSSQYGLVFTSSATEANNQVMETFADSGILVATTEHLSTLNSAVDRGANLLQVDRNGLVTQDEMLQMSQGRPNGSLVSIMQVNNETGVINDISELALIAKNCGLLFHSDVSQSIGKVASIPIDLDYYTISGHKIGAPVGVGCLIYKLSAPLKSVLKGGGQEMFKRAGTENLIFAKCLAQAVEDSINSYPSYYQHTVALQRQLESAVVSLGGMVVGSGATRVSNTSNIIMSGADSMIQIIKMESGGIAVSSGSACSSGKVEVSHVLLAMGIEKKMARCSIRVSTGMNNTAEEINRLLDIWKSIPRSY